MLKMSRAAFLAMAMILLTVGCASVPGPAERIGYADRQAHAHDWRPMTLEAGRFPLRAYGPAPFGTREILTVYLEGDGLAWVTRSRPSTDPTPVKPVGLQLALADPGAGAVYLARPCQYIMVSSCRPAYWLGKRFSPEIVEATAEALDALKTRYRAQAVLLVGYSGGGAVATLLAAERDDVVALVTVAGNLDHELWTRHHRISPLSGSLNPADRAPVLAALPQWHFTGAQDDIIPPEVVRAYIERLPRDASATHTVEPAFDHRCCWVEAWPGLISEIRSALNSGK